jgi:hypothetical protein
MFPRGISLPWRVSTCVCLIMAWALGRCQQPTSAKVDAAKHNSAENSAVKPGASPATLVISPAVPENPAGTSVASLASTGSHDNASAISPVRADVKVDAREDTLQSGLSSPYHVTQNEVLSSAGTWGDFTRYLQMLPGVVWNTDMSNDVMVRGGNPLENLYVVDGIEVPNINHIALEGTTGGFTSMIDTSTIGSVDLKAGVYDPRYSSRMSSLIEIRTRESQPSERTGEVSLGISGAGGLLDQPFGNNASLMLSAHRSILNLVTSDIGMNGVPIYTNGLARLQWSPGSKDHISALSLSGADSILITPAPCDVDVTISDLTQYRGGRTTDGMVWQHIYGPSVVATLTASYSMQSQNVAQQEQATIGNHQPGCRTNPAGAVTIYSEHSRDDTPTLEYEVQKSHGNWLFSLGSTARLAHMNYDVAQPLGQQSPFNPSPTWTDSDNFARDFTTGQTGSFAQITGTFAARWTLVAGAREETFALAHAHMFEPRVSLAYRINEHQAVNATFERAAQLAPAINLLSYAQNQLLRPLQVQQFTVGAQLWRADRATLSLESYHKSYTNEPVSTEYPSLMLANMVDTLGQQFVWLPLKTGGHGKSEGVELLLRARWANRVQLLASTSYGRTFYAAADGVMRPGNFDFPLVTNGMMTIRLPWRLEASIRNTFASGRPYTPFNIPLSDQQSRGIYDLTRVNGLRGPAYNRLDGDFNRTVALRGGVLKLYGGVENALNRANFLGYAWLDNCSPQSPLCGGSVIPGVPETRLTQMPIFPSAGARFAF